MNKEATGIIRKTEPISVEISRKPDRLVLSHAISPNHGRDIESGSNNCMPNVTPKSKRIVRPTPIAMTLMNLGSVACANALVKSVMITGMSCGFV